ncbi:uncharacterized protein LOC127787584 [Diospyros lotus]|uniref:uncharacterized protein LOC127787584 n=1 Tax=Diospyros lotus TaxID=55363 RepID=UPI00225936F3|nr:uncharacterized protein LOC127787584 [Diospyros lotus]
MAPFEALYGRPCRSLLCWAKVGDRSVLGPDIIEQTTEKVKLIRARMKTTQDLQKSYVNKRRQDLEFVMGDHAFLRVMPTRGIRRLGVSSKLSPCYVGSFEVLERIRPLANHLALPPQFAQVHDVFHVSMLRRCVADPGQFIDYQPLEVREDASYTKISMCVVDQKEKVL